MRSTARAIALLKTLALLTRARTEDVLQAGFVLQWIAVEGTALQPEQHDNDGRVCTG